MKAIHPITYRHVDVFSEVPLSGNGLTVFLDHALSPATMQALTQEMRQYESIFLFSTPTNNCFQARIFTIEEELDFAGHPILGAACVLHEKFKKSEQTASWIFELRQKIVVCQTSKKGLAYFASMDQGTPAFDPCLTSQQALPFLSALNLLPEDQYPSLPLQVVSTGLPYLIIPIRSCLEKVKVISDQLDCLLNEIGAKFAYILDIENREGRTWDNAGCLEDIATGSAAGPAGAYLVKYKCAEPNANLIIHQGRFLNRPSQIFVHVVEKEGQLTAVEISGQVCMVARGTLDPFDI